ncbi:MAG: DUF4440 domain-containing protein [Gammaproteobacteria bacterium]|nr:DUF4440 domain-containing protein [Gammaproteobacteria bacterium]|tara:strand:+ start:217 stop:699 length:483 start_codon:yes stop_codon:yes gene_type:complete
MRKLLILMCLFFVASIQADNHTEAEMEVAVAFDKYFNARVTQDWDTVAAMESADGTYNTNSDGSFHKVLAKTSAAQWKASGQSGSLNTYYPEFSQISDGVVYVRFYYEGIARNGDISSDYRTRVTQNWVKENGNWVVKTQHYSPAQFGGVHITVASDFED